MEYKVCRYVLYGYWICFDCDKCCCFNGRIFCILKYYFGCGKFEIFVFIIMNRYEKCIYLKKK